MNALTILGLGDSLTFGWSVKQGFFNRCIDQLAEEIDHHEVRGINHGISGDTAQGGQGRLDRVLAIAPEIVTVQFGINDSYGGVPVESFQAAYRSLAQRLIDAGVQPVLVTSCPLFDDEKMIAPFYDAIREVAAALGVPLADLERHWRESSGPARPDDLFLFDGVHPSDAGHALMAAGLSNTLRDLAGANPSKTTNLSAAPDRY